MKEMGKIPLFMFTGKMAKQMWEEKAFVEILKWVDKDFVFFNFSFWPSKSKITFARCSKFYTVC